MWCLVSQPNSVVVEVEVPPKAKGQEVLEKACEVVGIKAESDYFGLRYKSAKGGELWLNLRNGVERQVSGHGGPPFRFALRVKFWVPPHLVLQESTRHQMFMQVRQELREAKLKLESIETQVKIGALLSQAEEGDWSPPHPTTSSAPADLHAYREWSLLLTGSEEKAAEISHLHSQMKGMKTSTAEYWVLNEVSALPNFGEEIFITKEAKLGIGPHGINIYKPSEKMIPYSAIRSASSLRRLFQLWYLDGEHDETLLEIKCDTCVIASGMYRSLTEKHAFYSCDTVRGAVTAQYIRDLKGTIVSIFNEASGLGKKYVFDIRRTCREVHDSARRALYEETKDEASGSKSESTTDPLPTPDGGSPPSPQELLRRLQDALTCRICMDTDVDTVLFPCKHMLSCLECAQKIASCPLCRSPIQSATRVFHPTLELRKSLGLSHKDSIQL